jgi:uncharacterized protein YdaU (DUF1376 family)
MAIGKAPAFQFYAAEYLADENVQLLTLEQEGIYVRLLAYCWREGSIPADPAKLSRLCKNAPAEALAGVIELFIPGSDGRLLHRRLEDERQKQEEYRKAQAANGSLGGRPSKPKPDKSQQKGSGLSDESQQEGSGLSGESQTKAKKRSSSASSFSSSSASSSSSPIEDKGKEPKTPAGTALAVRAPSEFDLERVYKAYPRHIGKSAAMNAIRAAVKATMKGTADRPPCSVAEAVEFLHGKASKFAVSPAGNADKFTPYPATWFNQSRFLDDEKEWKGETNGTHTTAAVGPATIREQRSNDAIDRAVQFHNETAGFADEAGEGELSRAGNF